MRLGVRAQLLGMAAATLALMVVVGALALTSLGSVTAGGSQMYAGPFARNVQAGAIVQAVLDEGRLVNKGIVQIADPAAQAAVDQEIATDETAVNTALSALVAEDLTAAQRTALTEMTTQHDAYGPLRDATRAATIAGDHDNAVAASNQAATVRTAMQAAAEQFVRLQQDQAKALDAQNGGTAGTANALVIGGLLAALLFGFALSFFIARRITRGVTAVQGHLAAMRAAVGSLSHCLARLAENDLSAEYSASVGFLAYSSRDEIGATAQLSNELLIELKAMAGNYETARMNLTATLGEVKDAADGVARTSKELTEAAHQSGAASGQIASTIGQVAAGAQDQAEAASATSASVQELTGVIRQVGSGATETTRMIAVSSEAVTRLGSAISAASAASGDVTTVSTAAAAAAADGLGAVEKTVTGMSRIKSAVDASAARVTELGAKSSEIGAIVETIDDIAEQTNLLALNAAIEAARAGEQGKGFAVVADEVRKLAERSGRATKEIAQLIAVVQRETEAAVTAMQAGAGEVAIGTTLADEAGTSLEAIASSVAATKAAVERITAAVASMGDASGGVASATDAIASIAARTDEAAGRMTVNADTVSRSVESIAAVSEENSAAAEEVSAATEELSAQVEEVVASASTLAEMAAGLDALVARFTLAGHEGLAAQVEAFKKAHLKWVDRVQGLLAGHDRWTATDVPDHHGCSLGKWYESIGRARFGSAAAFESIEAPHARFHEQVRAVVVAHERGDRAAAEAAAVNVGRLSADVVRALAALATEATAGSGAPAAHGRAAVALRKAA